MAECKWTDNEINTLLDLIESKKVVEKLDSKRQKNSQIFQSISEHIEGKSMLQCREKWKNLKKKYREEKRKQNSSG